MDIERVIIREMRTGEEKALARVARQAFQVLEALAVSTPKDAMVAEYEGKLIGGIMYKYISTARNRFAYIDQAFVAPDYHGKGVGRKLYTETFRFLLANGADGMTGLVKDDNVGSWKLFADNGFVRASLWEGVKKLGFSGMLKQCVKTPLLFGVGMDFYLYAKEPAMEKKNAPLKQLATFTIANFMLALFLWVKYAVRDAAELLPAMLAFLTVLALFLLPRLVNALVRHRSGRLRFNNCGALIPLALGLVGNVFPMNLNWYPDVYENTPAFRRKLAIPELTKYAMFALLPVLLPSASTYLHLVAQLSAAFLVFLSIPLYPFEAFGAGRVYRWNKIVWAITAIITLAELIFVWK